MENNNRRMYGNKRFMGYMAVLVVFAMVITGITIGSNMRDNTLLGKYARAESAQDNSTTGLTKVVSPFEQVYELVGPSVVEVNIVSNLRFANGRPSSSSQLSGSGVVIQKDYVLTNYHVVEGGQGFSVTANGQEYSAEYIGGDEATDLAILKVENLPVTPVVMGDSDALKVGEWAIVIGTPLSTNLANTLTVGVVSGLDREIQTVNRSNRYYSPTNLIQVDAAINNGNSGGALFNTAGELIGIPSLKLSTNGYYGAASVEGIGLAIPVNVAKPIIDSLIQYKTVYRPRIGVEVDTLVSPSDELTEDTLPASIIVKKVEEKSPAQEAGIKAYDLILEADGQRVRTPTELNKIIQSHKAGETVTLKILRIPNLNSLQLSDKIPAGETLELKVETRILDAENEG